MPLKPFARPRQSVGASPSDSPPSSVRPATPTPHGKSSLSRITTFDDAEASGPGSPLRKRIPRATVHGTPYITAGTQSSAPPTDLHTPPTPHLSTPTARSRARLSIAPTPGSPYYSPDSPSQISRSTIIPFDTAASRRAAQEGQERLGSVQGGRDGADPDAGGTVPQTPVGKVKTRLATLLGTATPQRTPARRRGVVRKRSLWDRIIHLPTEITDAYIPDRFALPQHTALPLALILHATHLLVRAPLFLEPRRRRRGAGRDAEWDEVFKTPEEISRGNLERFERVEPTARRGIVSGSTSWVVFFVLLAVAAGNAWYLFTAYRRYDLRFRPTPVDSPHVKTVIKPETETEPEQVVPPQAKALAFAKYYLSPSVVWRFVNGQYLEAGDAGPGLAGRKRGDTMQVLHIWDPSDFRLVFFSYFSPLHVLLAHLFYPTHYLVLPPVLACLTAHLTLLISAYQWLVKDRTTLNAEVMREYDQGFVYKKLFATRMDKSVQTSEAEMLY